MCDHSPLAAEDCQPHKSLRLTVKAFIKSKEKKSEKSRITVTAQKSAAPADTKANQETNNLPAESNGHEKVQSEDVAANGNTDKSEERPDSRRDDKEEAAPQGQTKSEVKIVAEESKPVGCRLLLASTSTNTPRTKNRAVKVIPRVYEKISLPRTPREFLRQLLNQAIRRTSKDSSVEGGTIAGT